MRISKRTAFLAEISQGEVGRSSREMSIRSNKARPQGGLGDVRGRNKLSSKILGSQLGLKTELAKTG